MMAKRGMKLEAVYFESPPYTSEQAREKVMTLAREVAQYAGPIELHVVSLTDIQERIVKTCEEEYFTLLLRRYMMSIADRLAEKFGCQALITGESLGQVASQTPMALAVTDIMANRPVFRPCIGMDKEEIVQIAYKIGTFETSILPYEDCCTVFTPKHPKTKPTLGQVLNAERNLDREKLMEEALANVEKVVVKFHDEPLL
jgi:thiamine biosynthesis protein ThiI